MLGLSSPPCAFEPLIELVAVAIGQKNPVNAVDVC